MSDRCTARKYCDASCSQNYGFIPDPNKDPDLNRYGYQIIDRHGEPCAFRILFCPWCGKRLPVRRPIGDDDEDGA